MRTIYYKDGNQTERPRAIVLNGLNILMPTDDQIIAAGYEVRQIQDPTPYVMTYEEKVAHFIRERYTPNDEFAILRQRDTKPEEFAEYNAFCEECKQKAKEL